MDICFGNVQCEVTPVLVIWTSAALSYVSVETPLNSISNRPSPQSKHLMRTTPSVRFPTQILNTISIQSHLGQVN